VDPRPLVNSQEKKVWHWLARTFPDHQVMVKIPITRYTIPRASEDSALLYDLLNKVYCTFSVCSASGNVVGCVDVRSGTKTISRSNQLLKLGCCRTAGFDTGSWSLMRCRKRRRSGRISWQMTRSLLRRGSRVGWACASQREGSMRATVERQRHSRKGSGEARGVKKPVPMKVDPSAREFAESEFERGAWQQADAFVVPLDSRFSASH
jgi:hypothetical protein